jgi:clan AA aspartic protease (TIGR02281 family)
MKVNILKPVITILLSFSLFSFGSAQNIYTKDGVSLGNRNDLIKNCAKDTEKEISDVPGLSLDPEVYCSCIFDIIIPRYTSDELNKIASNDALIQLIVEEENWMLIMDCMGDNLKVDDDYVIKDDLNYQQYSEQSEMIAVRACVNEMKNDPLVKEILDYLNPNALEELCSCMMPKLYADGYTWAQIMDAENASSIVFNEVMARCVEDVFPELNSGGQMNSYEPSDIIGRSYSTVVELLGSQSVFRIKISIDGFSRYFIFDTGASVLVIDSNTERELLLRGAIKREHYLGKENYMLANNEVVEARLVRLNNVQIGDYTVNNVVAAIIDQGEHLAGLGFLKKFNRWEIDTDQKIITLFR